MSWIPHTFCSLSNRILWSNVSNAADKSYNTRAIVDPLLIEQFLLTEIYSMLTGSDQTYLTVTNVHQADGVQPSDTNERLDTGR